MSHYRTETHPAAPEPRTSDDAGTSAHARLLTVAAPIVVFVLTLGLLARHRNGGALWKTLWAEDGRIFLGCNQTQGLGGCLFQTYTGYQQFLPRILAAVAALFPVADWPRAVSALALLFDAFALTLIYLTSRWLVPSALLRALLVLTMAGSAAIHLEVAGNLANLHWMLIASSLFVAVNPDARPGLGPTVLRAAWLVTSCLSEALAPVILVVFVIGLVLRRRRSTGRWHRGDLVTAVLLVACVIVQIVSQLVNPRVPPIPPPISVGTALHRYREQVGRVAWNDVGSTSDHFYSAAVAVVLVLFVVGLIVAAVRPRRERLTGLIVGPVLIVGSAAWYVLNTVVNHVTAPRYMGGPFILLVMGVGCVLAALYRDWPGRASIVRYVPAVAVLAAVVALLAVPVVRPNVDTLGHGNWRSHLRQSAAACPAGSDGTGLIMVQIAPGYTWAAPVPCARVPAQVR